MSEAARFFSPRAVAVCGSVSPGKLGAVLIERLVGGGFERIYAVNPKAQGTGDVKGFASFSEIPDTVDMAVIATPATTVAGVLDDAGKAGVRAAVIISSGFSEAGHPELEEEVKAVAKRHGIRYIGPNCAGMANTNCNLLATLEAAPAKGSVAIISQSGAVGGMIMSASAAGAVGIGKFVSYGNGSDLGDVELLSLMADDPETSVIAMYLENVRRGRAFMDALSKATRKKPVVIIKSGRTEGGRRAALSHTGSMAGADAVYDAAFRKCGAVRVDSIEEMLDTCNGFSSTKCPAGKKVVIITNSGGPGVMTADRSEGIGLDTGAPSDALKAELKTFLPPHAGLANPLDITVEGTAEQYGATVEAALKEYDAAIIVYIGTQYLKALPVAEAVVAAAKKANKPVLANFDIGSDIVEARTYLDSHGVPCYSSGERAATVIAHMWAAADLAKTVRLDVNGVNGSNAQALSGVRAPLEEPEAVELLASHGISVADHGFATNADEAVALAKRIGYPVCMKIVSPNVIHKSDVGGVKLNVADEAAVRTAYEQLAGIDPAGFRGAMVYPMLKKGVELIMGLTRDVQFGPVIAFGTGGIFAEVMKDAAVAIAPLTLDEAHKLLRSVKAYGLIKGARGDKPKDEKALADMLVKLSELMFVHEDIAEVDLNPVFAYEDGAIAADVRIILGGK